MEIIIPLPQCNSSSNTYQELRSYLKQLELAVHHAQKSIEHAEKDGVEISEDSFITFDHPSLERSVTVDALKDGISSEEKTLLERFIDNYYDELQNIVIKINLNN